MEIWFDYVLSTALEDKNWLGSTLHHSSVCLSFFIQENIFCQLSKKCSKKGWRLWIILPKTLQQFLAIYGKKKDIKHLNNLFNLINLLYSKRNRNHNSSAKAFFKNINNRKVRNIMENHWSLSKAEITGSRGKCVIAIL